MWKERMDSLGGFMKVVKMIFAILSILSVIAVIGTALMFNSGALTDFWQTAGIMILFGVLAFACMGGVIITDNAIDIIEGRKEIQRGIEK